MGDIKNKLIPNKWMWVKIGDIYNIVGGGTPSTNNPEFWNGDIPWITSADIYGLHDIRPRKVISKNGIANSATSLVPGGSIIVVTRVGLGKLTLSKNPICFSQDSQALLGNSELINPKYSLYFLSNAVEIFKYQNRGTTIPGVTKKQLSELLFPLSPINEQHRIVEKIEELFTKLDVGVAALEKVRAQLKRYRQAVLKAAFSGQLTAEWRQKHSGVGAGLSRPKKSYILDAHGGANTAPLPNSDLPDLPVGWEWTTLNNCSVLITKGESPKWQGFNYVTDGILFIRSENVLWGSVAVIGAAKIPISFHNKLKRSQLQKNDVLINLVGASIGRAAIFYEEAKSANINQAVALIRLESNLISKYLLNLLLSPLIQSSIHSNKVETARPNISLADLRELIIPLPSISEQCQIVSEIERRFSVADEVEKTVENSLKQARRLRQSILKMAFEGKLVPQDPNDEPTEKLLERIKKQKEEMAQVKKQKGRKNDLQS